jgi:phage head maturation protease
MPPGAPGGYSRRRSATRSWSWPATGVPLGLSVGFLEVPGDNRWHPDRRRVTRTRVHLDHVAAVRVPAYEGAGVVGVRGAAIVRPTPALLTLARLRHG